MSGAETDVRQVLVADASEEVRSQIGLTLGEDSFRVAEAVDTTEAVVALARERPDIVLVDADLPGGGGIALVRSLKAQPETAHASAVLMFDKASPVDESEGRESGVDDFLAKPFNAFALLKKLDGLSTRD